MNVVNHSEFVCLNFDHHAPFLISKMQIETNTMSNHNHIALDCLTIKLHVSVHVQQLQIVSSNEETTPNCYTPAGVSQKPIHFYKHSIPSDVNIPLMIPSIWLALLITFRICISTFRHSAKVNPRSVS